MVMVAVMSILLTVAAQQWSFLTRRELERELTFRGERLLLALNEHQARVGGAPPTSLEDLTKPPRPVLPRVWPDPMTARYDGNGDLVEGTGEWQVIRVGDPAAGASPTTRDQGGFRERRPSGPATPAISGLRGVHSASEELSIGAWRDTPPGTPYNEWRFEVQFGRTDTGTAGGREARIDERPPGFGGLRAPGGPPVRNPLIGAQPGAQPGGRSGRSPPRPPGR
jgi:type II secretory pathway pseudopilin PulG